MIGRVRTVVKEIRVRFSAEVVERFVCILTLLSLSAVMC